MATNNLLPNGLVIISIKRKINEKVLVVLSDFQRMEKVWVDTSAKKLLDAEDIGVAFSPGDFDVIKSYAEATK